MVEKLVGCVVNNKYNKVHIFNSKHDVHSPFSSYANEYAYEEDDAPFLNSKEKLLGPKELVLW